MAGALTPITTRLLNQQILAALTADHGREVSQARLVHHARAAGDDDAVLMHAPRAARESAAVGAHREAARHYQAARPLLDRLPAPERVRILESHSIEAYLAGFSADAIAAREAALVLHEQAGDRVAVGVALRWLSRLYWWAGQRARAESLSAEAITVLTGSAGPAELAMALSNQSQLDMLATRNDAAITGARRALELAEPLGDAAVISHALTNMGTARIMAGDPDGDADLERAYAVAAAAGLDDHAGRALVNLAASAVEMRDYTRGVPALQTALAFVDEHDLVGYRQHLLGHRARVRLDEGDWAGAEDDARAALADSTQAGHRVVEALAVLGTLQARRGEPAARATVGEAIDLAADSDELQCIAPAASAAAELAWLTGRDADIPAAVADALTLAHA